MGRASEYFRCLKTKPKHLQDFKETIAYITIDDNMKKQRRKLALFNELPESENDKNHGIKKN